MELQEATVTQHVYQHTCNDKSDGYYSKYKGMDSAIKAQLHSVNGWVQSNNLLWLRLQFVVPFSWRTDLSPRACFCSRRPESRPSWRRVHQHATPWPSAPTPKCASLAVLMATLPSGTFITRHSSGQSEFEVILRNIFDVLTHIQHFWRVM